MTPQERLDQAVEEFERGRDIYPDVGDYSLCPTGEPYLVFTCGGVKQDGERSKVFCTTAESAIQYWIAEFEKYAANHSGRLYWRCRPEIEVARCRPEIEVARYIPTGLPHPTPVGLTVEFWQVYGRACISSKPAIQPAFHRDNPKYAAVGA